MQVPLGVILKCETKTEEMVDICEVLQSYVPTSSKEHVVAVTDEEGHEQEFKVFEDHFNHVLLGMHVS